MSDVDRLGSGLRRYSLSVVLPAYNEEGNIERVVDRSLATLSPMVTDLEVIVVDDGSRDATSEVARRLVDAHPEHVRLIRHTQNLGYGAAIRTGMRAASKELVFYTDSDNQFDVAELEYFFPMVPEHDLIVGFRVYRYDRVLRSMVSWVYNRIVNLMFRVRVRDVDCAFKLFRREVVDKITIQCDDFFVDTEMVAKARKWNFRIAEKGVRHYPRTAGETTVQISDVPRTLQTIGRLWRRIYFPKRVEHDAGEPDLSSLTEEYTARPAGVA